MDKKNGSLQHDTPIQFPCDFLIKIIGKADSDFEKTAIQIVKNHFPNWDNTKLEKKFSKDNNFLSLSITVHALSKPELDALYQALSDEPLVVMAL